MEYGSSMYSYEYKMSPAAVTGLIMSNEGDLVLFKRAPDSDAYPNYWSLVGGFLESGQETLEEALVREIQEEVSITIDAGRLRQLFMDSNVGNADPRYEQVLNLSMLLVLNKDEISSMRVGSEIVEIKVVPNNSKMLSGLAFEHSSIAKRGLEILSREGAGSVRRAVERYSFD